AITNFNTVFLSPQRRLRVSPRFDYQLSTNNTLTLRYGYTRNDVQNSGIGTLSLLSRGTHNFNTDQNVQPTQTAILSAKVINETLFQFFHVESQRLANNNTPTLNVSGAFNGGGAQIGHSNDSQNHYELQNYMSVAHGAHSLKFGVRVRAVTDSSFSPSNFGGAFSFAGGYWPIPGANKKPGAPGGGCGQKNPHKPGWL